MTEEPDDKKQPHVQLDGSGGDDGGGKRKTSVGARGGDDDENESGKLISLAMEFSRKHGHNFVGSESLMYALIKCKSGRASEALQKLALPEEEVCEKISENFGVGSGHVAEEIPFTPNMKKILEHSWDIARKRGDNFIGSEHLLLAILQNDFFVVTLLKDYGIDAEKVESLLGSI